MDDKITHNVQHWLNVEHWLAVLNTYSKEEGDAFLEILNWDYETRVAFRIAKKMYDDNFVNKEVL